MKLRILLFTLLLTSGVSADFSTTSLDDFIEFSSSRTNLKKEIEELKSFTLDAKLEKELISKSIKQIALVINHTSKGEISFRDAYREIKSSVEKFGVHDGLLTPSLNLIDSYIVNGRRDLVGNMGPIISTLNPRISNLLETHLSISKEFDEEDELQEKLSLVDTVDFSDLNPIGEFSHSFGLTNSVNSDLLEDEINIFGTQEVTSLNVNIRGPREFEGDDDSDIDIFADPSGRGPIMGERVASGNSCMRGCIGGFVGGGFAGIPGGLPGIVFGGIGGGIAGCASSCGNDSPGDTPPRSTPEVNDPPENDPPTTVEPPSDDVPEDENPGDETPKDDEPDSDDPNDDDDNNDSIFTNSFDYREHASMINVRIRNNIRFIGRGL